MAAKPEEYFLGLHDFFALLLPGAFLTFWGRPLLFSILDRMDVRFEDQEAVLWIAFLLVAFLVGQALFVVASWLDEVIDPLLEKFHKDHRKAIEAQLPAAIRSIGKPWH